MKYILLFILTLSLLPKSHSQHTGFYTRKNVFPEMVKSEMPSRIIIVDNQRNTWNDLVDFDSKDSLIQLKNNQIIITSGIDTWKGLIYYTIDTSVNGSHTRFRFKLTKIENYESLLALFKADTLHRELLANQLTDIIYYPAKFDKYVSAFHLKEFQNFLSADKMKVYSFMNGVFYDKQSKTYNNSLSLVKTINKTDKKSFQFFFINKNYGYEFSRCYEPHDAVEYFKNNRSIGFIEICFECNEVRFYDFEKGIEKRFSLGYDFAIGYEKISGKIIIDKD